MQSYLDTRRTRPFESRLRAAVVASMSMCIDRRWLCAHLVSPGRVCEDGQPSGRAHASRYVTSVLHPPAHWDHCMGRMLQVKNSDASSRFYHKSIAHTSQSILRQHIQAIKQLQRCKCATMLARNTAWSRHAGAYGDHGPEICCATPGPNNCTERDQNRREPHERKTDARIHPILMCGLRGVAELSAAQGRGELLKRHHTR